MPEFRRIFVDGVARTVEVSHDQTTWIDGRRISGNDAVHLPPVTPTKIACIHLSSTGSMSWAASSLRRPPISGSPFRA